MSRADELLDALEAFDITAAYGVPDSLLAALTHALHNRPGHIVAPNEGAAIGLAVGHYLSTARPAMVYMQNSGLGNAVNPLVSMARVYEVPMLLVIGWRGEVIEGAQMPDEPQHQQMGQVTLRLLELLEIPYVVMDRTSDVQSVVAAVVPEAHPTALVVRKGALGAATRAPDNRGLMSREEAIAAVLSVCGQMPVVATTGNTSREVSLLRDQRGEHNADFLNVGGMGHALAVAVGITDSGRQVVCLDGDGAALMHLGTLALAASRPGLIHVVLNNGAHDSVGAQPTAAPEMRFAAVARALGYDTVTTVTDAPGIAHAVRTARGSTMVEVLCACGVRPDLGRPTQTPRQTRAAFMAKLTAPAAP